MSQAHSRYIARETGIGLVINTALSIAFALLVARGRAAVPLWGVDGVALDFVPQTFMLAVATTLAMTLTTRKRLRRGEVMPLPLDQAGLLARLPRNVMARAVLIALLLTIVLTPLCAGMLSLLDVTAVPLSAFLVMKALYGAALTLVAGPKIVRAALA